MELVDFFVISHNVIKIIRYSAVFIIFYDLRALRTALGAVGRLFGTLGGHWEVLWELLVASLGPLGLKAKGPH